MLLLSNFGVVGVSILLALTAGLYFVDLILQNVFNETQKRADKEDELCP